MAGIPNLLWNGPPRPPADSLDRVDFDDPEVIAAIQKAFREYKRSPEVEAELKKYEPTPIHWSVWMMTLP